MITEMTQMPRIVDRTAVYFGNFLAVLAVTTVLQTGWYYVGGNIGLASGLLALAVALAIYLPLTVKQLKQNDGYVILANAGIHWKYGWIPVFTGMTKTKIWTALLLLASLTVSVFILRSAWLNGTSDAIRTPWPLLPSVTLLAFAVLGLMTWFAAARRLPATVVAILSALSLAPIFFLTVLLYKNGFGFDGFLHRASEQLLLTTGTLSPKPFYYMGQYVFTVWLTRLFHLPLYWIDQLLLPCFATLLVPVTYLAFKNSARLSWILAGLPLILPLAAFVTTTPQSLAYLVGLIALLLTLSDTLGPSVTWPVAAWAVAIHPLAGLPFFGAVLALSWLKRCRSREQNALRSPLTWLLLLGSITVVPLAFFILGKVTPTQITWNFSALVDLNKIWLTLGDWLTLPRPHAALWPDAATFVAFIQPFLIFVCAVYGWFQDKRNRTAWTICLTLSLGSVLVGLIMRVSGDFSFLIDYERANFADRLFVLAHLFLVPPALVGLAAAVERVRYGRKISLLILLFLCLAVWNASQIYNALPRHDAAAISRGWSVSQADQEAVRGIEADAKGQPYTVLANQSVSAAAVEAFGFKRYAGDVFYYPIPTGGPLYQVFLATVNARPTRDIIKKAAELGQSDLVYVVLDDYWWNFDQLNNQLTAIADRSASTKDQRVMVYRFDFSKH